MSDSPDQNDPPKDPKELEKLEEAKLKAKFPNAMLGGRGPGGHSAFLQKRLAKGLSMSSSDHLPSGDLLARLPPYAVKKPIAAKVLRLGRLPNGEAAAGEPRGSVQGAGRARQDPHRRRHPHARHRARAEDLHYTAQVPAAEPDVLAAGADRVLARPPLVTPYHARCTNDKLSFYIYSTHRA